MDQKLNGSNPLSYRGVNAYSPPEFVTHPRPPTTKDWRNFIIGTIWLDSNNPIPLPSDIYMLVSLGHQILSPGTPPRPVATWISFGGGGTGPQTLTGDDGIPVSPDGALNTNLVSGILGIEFNGNPGTNTLELSSVGGHELMKSLSDDIGVKSYADILGDIAVKGTLSRITSTSDGVNTITLDVGQNIATSFTADDAGVATPIANDILVLGAGTVTTSALGNTILITGSGGGGGDIRFTEDTDYAISSAGNINILGANGISTVGDLASTVTIGTDGTLANSYTTDDTNTAIPVAGNINVFGTLNHVTTTSSGNTITIDTGTQVATTYTCDAGSANPLNGLLRVIGGSNVSTSGSGDTVTITSSLPPSNIKTTYFLASGTWTPDPSTNFVTIYGWCGGGGGGGGAGAATVGNTASGGGGGAQGTVFVVDNFARSYFGVSETITIGGGGGGGAGGIGTPGLGVDGGDGGITSIGSLIVPASNVNHGHGGTGSTGIGGTAMTIIFVGNTTITTGGGANGVAGTGGSASYNTVSVVLNKSLAGTGGGGGGGYSGQGATVISAGGNGGAQLLPNNTVVVAKGLGNSNLNYNSIPDRRGFNGYDGTYYNGVLTGGTGGGGSSGCFSNTALIVARGGKGGFPGAGGGGGGGGHNSGVGETGPGGSGGDGLVIIIETP